MLLVIGRWSLAPGASPECWLSQKASRRRRQLSLSLSIPNHSSKHFKGIILNTYEERLNENGQPQ
jgi:hypothetical protein